jgi:hypothetical protein
MSSGRKRCENLGSLIVAAGELLKIKTVRGDLGKFLRPSPVFRPVESKAVICLSGRMRNKKDVKEQRPNPVCV